MELNLILLSFVFGDCCNHLKGFRENFTEDLKANLGIAQPVKDMPSTKKIRDLKYHSCIFFFLVKSGKKKKLFFCFMTKLVGCA